ncbi:hypothetical protein [Streptomyces albus]|uniref:hypothetical protein n=1 Tax=Streptomyces TaxID=1883 RepID=UPI00133125DD|nr:hypothetical protein [Streptomyces sp. NRRL F-5917]
MSGTGFERYTSDELREYLRDEARLARECADEPNTVRAVHDTIDAMLDELRNRGEA